MYICTDVWDEINSLCRHITFSYSMQGCCKQLKSGEAINTKLNRIFLKKDCTKLLGIVRSLRNDLG